MRTAAILAAVATATPVSAQSVEDRARSVLLIHYRNPLLTEAQNIAAHDCLLYGLPDESLIRLANAQTRADVEVIAAFAPVEAICCELDVRPPQ